MTNTEKKLVDMGLRVWARGGMRRIYINPWDFGKVFGLDLSFYKTGNIRSAFLNGEKISNSRADKLLGNDAPYYNCNTGKWRRNKLPPII